MPMKTPTGADWRQAARGAMGAGAARWANAQGLDNGLDLPQMRWTEVVHLDPGERIQVKQYDENGNILIIRKRPDGSARSTVTVPVGPHLPSLPGVTFAVWIEHDSSPAKQAETRRVTLVLREDLWEPGEV